MPDRIEDFALRVRDNDNVAVAKRPLAANLSLNGSISLTTDREIPAGHKIAIAAIAQGDPIFKYGQVIGYARRPISPGQHVHTHNVTMRADADDRTQLAHECCIDYRPTALYPPDLQPEAMAALQRATLEPASEAVMASLGVDARYETPARVDRVYDRVARALAQARPPQVALTRYQSLDPMGHYFLRYAAPSEFGDVTDEERHRLGQQVRQQAICICFGGQPTGQAKQLLATCQAALALDSAPRQLLM